VISTLNMVDFFIWMGTQALFLHTYINSCSRVAIWNYKIYKNRAISNL